MICTPSLSDLQWVTNGYLLALAVSLIVGGKIGDRFGRRLIFVIGVVGFALMSLACALSTTIDEMIAFRVAQGIAGAMLMPNTLALIRATFPPDKLGQAVGIWGGSTALATASGPIIGGLLVQHVSWQSIFLINLPLGVITLGGHRRGRGGVARRRRRPRVRPAWGHRSLGRVVLRDLGADRDRQPRLGLRVHADLLLGGLALLVVFTLWERRAKYPLLSLDLFRSRSLSAGTVLVMFGFLGLFGVLFFVTLYLQNVHGFSPVQAGVRMLRSPACSRSARRSAASSPASSGPACRCWSGCCWLALGMFGLRDLGVDSSYVSMWPWFLALGVALGLTVVASTEAIVGNAPVGSGGLAGGSRTLPTRSAACSARRSSGRSWPRESARACRRRSPTTASGPGLAKTLIAAKPLIAEGGAPITAKMSAHVQMQVVAASHEAFMSGLHLALLEAAIISLVGAAIALVVQRGTNTSDGSTLSI